MRQQDASPGGTREALGQALPVWLLTRLAVLVAGYIGVMAIGFGNPPPWTASDNPALNLVARWDTGWYLPIAQNGYTWPPAAPGGQSEVAFFPLYPLAMRYLGLLLGGRLLLAGWLISMGACLWALVYFYRLARLHLQRDEAAAAMLFLASYPFAVYYSAVYTESLFLLCMVAAVFHASRGQPWQAAAWGLLGGLTRNTGFLVAVVVGLIAAAPLIESRLPGIRRWLGGTRPARAAQDPGAVAPRRHGMRAGLDIPLLAASLAPVAGLALYSVYVYRLTGDPFAWRTVQSAWGRSDLGLSAFAGTLRAIYGLGVARWSARPIDALNELAAAFALLAAWPVLRRFGLGYALFLVLSLVPALLSGGVRSLGRFTAPLFPLFLWLGAAVPPGRRDLVVFGFALLQAIVALLFFTWRPIM